MRSATPCSCRSSSAIVLALVAGALIAVAGGCGTGGDAGQGAADLPLSGGGPFRRLPREGAWKDTAAPFVLIDPEPETDLDEPWLLADDVIHGDGHGLGLWVSAARAGTVRIEHADAEDLARGFGALEPVLAPMAAWEGASVSGPSLIAPAAAGEPWLLFYLGGADPATRMGGVGIGWATSPDGHSFSRGPAPTLTADGGVEGDRIGPPAAVRLGDRVRVYYPAAGRLWAAEAPFADLAAGRSPAWTRLDGDDLVPGRDPILAALPWSLPDRIGRTTARIAITPAGRLRHDLYVTAESTLKDLAFAAGFAASYTGQRFRGAPDPLVAIGPAYRAPSMVPYEALPAGPGGLIVFVQRTGRHDAIAAAIAP